MTSTYLKHLILLTFLTRRGLCGGKDSLSHQSIFTADNYVQLEPCARVCYLLSGWDQIGYVLQCDEAQNSPAPNGCFCREDKQSAAVSYLSSCIKKQCTVGDYHIDMSAGVAVYTNYCLGLGYIPATTTTVEATPTATVQNTPTVTQTIAGGQTAQTNVVTQTQYVTYGTVIPTARPVGSGEKLSSGVVGLRVLFSFWVFELCPSFRLRIRRVGSCN